MTVAVAFTPSRELTVDDLCALTGDPERTVRRRVAGWYDRQHHPDAPRVRRARDTGDARWCYLVDAASYDAWLSREPSQIPASMTAGSDAAHAHGCRCVVMHTATESGAYVVKTCPLHGAIV